MQNAPFAWALGCCCLWVNLLVMTFLNPSLAWAGRRSEGKHSVFSPYSEETQALHVFKNMWLHIYSFLLIFAIFHYVCMYTYMIYTHTHSCAHMCMMLMPTESEAIDSTRASSCELWALVLRLKLRALARAVSTHNHGAISSDPRHPYGIYWNPSNRDQCRPAH